TSHHITSHHITSHRHQHCDCTAPSIRDNNHQPSSPLQMFRGSPANPYDEVVLKATDEAQTSENWSLFIQVCDKVLTDTTPNGARDCIGAIQKRLQHRNANVQLFCLTLTESLVKNTNENLHKEVSSRAFMKVLSNLVTDRYTHEKVKKRILQCLKSWAEDFNGKPQLGLVEETVDELKEKGHQYQEEEETSTTNHHHPDELLKREEEELQRAIAESEREAEWMNMAGVGNFPASSSIATNQFNTIGPTGHIPSSSQARFGNPPLAAAASSHPQPSPNPPIEAMAQMSIQNSSHQHNAPLGPDLHPPPITKTKPAPRKVRALYDFEPNEEGELSFREGDIIRVIDSVYKDWWKGELRGQIGIFPVNYIETIPDPSPETLSKEAEAEAVVFGQANEIDRLLEMMNNLDAKRDNLADNDELSELYQRTLSMRPKIVRLIEKYTQKKAELLQINSKFMTAKTTYDTMIEQSLAVHHPGVGAEAFTQPHNNNNPNPNPNIYQSQGPYPQVRYPSYEQNSYPNQVPINQHYQRPNGPPTSSPSPNHHQRQQKQQYPAREVIPPEGIDTSRYYLASDGNWYAYSVEQLAAKGLSPRPSPNNLPTTTHPNPHLHPSSSSPAHNHATVDPSASARVEANQAN
ncbi:hypothetical protein MJO28_016825, partial [Puccinia striiformis f. sp. tritici]